MRYLLVIFSLLFPAAAMSNTFTPTKDRTVNVIGAIDENSLGAADEILKLADGSGKPIDLLIQSPGGMIYVGRTIVQSMSIAKRRGHQVRCAVVSYAASMAFTVLANCSERYALPEARMLYHPPRVGLFMTTMTPEAASQLADDLHKTNKEIIDELLALYPVARKPFLKNYYREVWHTAADLNAALPGGRAWITIVDDIAGLSTVVSDKSSDFSSAASGQIIYQYLPN